MKALSQVLVLSLIQTGASLSSTLTAVLALAQVGKQAACLPPLPAISYEVAVSLQRPQEPQEAPFPSLKLLTQLHNLQTQAERCEVAARGGTLQPALLALVHQLPVACCPHTAPGLHA